jgi:hypothetical protein
VNTVRVRLQRSEAGGNAIPTFLLKLVGVPSWEMGATGMSALLTTKRCGNANGLFAAGTITLDDASSVGAGYCLHSQTAVNLAGSVEFLDGASLSMPDIARCQGQCTADVHPGIAEARASVNFQTPGTRGWIEALYAGLTDPDVTLPQEAAFFESRKLAADLSPLEEMAIETFALQTGDLVRLTPMEFSKMRAFPAGLIYAVSCATESFAPEEEIVSTLTVEGMGFRKILKDLVLVTDCAVAFDRMAVIEGSMILTMSGTGQPAFSVEPGTTAGDAAQACDPAGHSVLIAAGDIALPGDFLTSNAALVAGGDVTLGAGNGNVVTHKGSTIHAGGALTVHGRHTFDACSQAQDPALPDLQVIRSVLLPMEMPETGAAAVAPVAPLVETPDLPGTAVKALDRVDLLVDLEEDRDSRARRLPKL